MERMIIAIIIRSIALRLDVVDGALETRTDAWSAVLERNAGDLEATRRLSELDTQLGRYDSAYQHTKTLISGRR